MDILLESAVKILENIDELNEAFSDSMPDWMRSRLIYFAPNASNKTKNRQDVKNQHNSIYSSRHSGEENLFKLLMNAGYDLSKMEVVSSEVPNKLEDEIFDNPDALPVFHLVSNNDDKIWIQGINDDEQFTDDENKTFKFAYMNNAKLKKYVKDFAYINLANPDTHKAEKQTTKKLGKQYSGEKTAYRTRTWSWSDEERNSLDDKSLLNRRFRFGKDSINGYSGSSLFTIEQEKNFDKSGYFRGKEIINPELKNRLRKFKDKRVPERIFKLESDLVDLRDSLQTLNQIGLFSYDLSDPAGVDALDSSSHLLSEYKDLISEFLTEIANKIGDWAKTNKDQSLPSIYSDKMLRFEKKLSNFKNKLKPYKKAIFVW